MARIKVGRRPLLLPLPLLLILAVALVGVVVACSALPQMTRWATAAAARERFEEDKDKDADEKGGRRVLESVQAGNYHIEVFDSGKAASLGKCISIDGRTQLCEADEHRYHEMLVHFAAAYADTPPENVVIVGGGDNFALREVLKYPSVKRVVVLDSEERLSSISEKHMMTNARRNDQRVKWVHGDIIRELSKLAESSGDAHVHQYDLAVIDCKFRPGQSFATSAVADNLLVLLKPTGIVAIGGCNGSSFSPTPFQFKVPYSFHSDTHDTTLQMSLHATFDLTKAEKPDRAPAAIGDVSVSFYDYKNHIKYVPWFLRAK